MMQANEKWFFVYDVPGKELGYRAIVNSEGETICNPSPMGQDVALLIRAAPDLLAALKGMVKRYGSPEGWPLDPDTNAEEIAARAAIAATEVRYPG